MEPEIVLAELEPLRRAIRYYYAEVRARKAARTANDSDMAAAQTEDLAIDMTAEGGDLDAPIIRLLNSLVQRAVTTTASDIHIEPFEGETKVRMRIDGVIIDYVTLQRALHQPLIARIKIMSNLDIAEHRIPAGRPLPRTSRDRPRRQRPCLDFADGLWRKGRAAVFCRRTPTLKTQTTSA